jgi:hypothetical protein
MYDWRHAGNLNYITNVTNISSTSSIPKTPHSNSLHTIIYSINTSVFSFTLLIIAL